MALNSGKLDLDSLNFTLFYAHSVLAKVSNTPEIALDEAEAKTMANACMNVMRHYNIKASQKAIDWGNLALTLALIYGGKFTMINKRIEAEKAARRRAAQSQAEQNTNFDLPVHVSVHPNGAGFNG